MKIFKKVLLSVLFIRSKLIFLLSTPFVLLGFWRREREREFRVVPRLWLTQTEIIELDLDYYEPDGGRLIDRALADEMLSVREKLSSRNLKLTLISTTGILFVYSQIFSFNMKLSVLGIQLVNVPGAVEVAYLAITAISIFVAINSQSIEIINGHIKYIINKKMEPQLKNFYEIKYLGSAIKIKYFPFNLVHLNQGKVNYSLYNIVVLLLLALLLSSMLIVIYVNYYLFIYLFQNGSFGWASKAIALLKVLELVVVAYSITVAYAPLPYRDYSRLHYFWVASQLHPERKSEFLNEVWGETVAESIDDRKDLVRRGYLKPDE